MSRFPGYPLKQNENFYLSWTESDQKFCVKKDLQGLRSLPNNHVAVDIKYVSFPAGSSKQLLDNIKSPQSRGLLQCAVGVIVDAGVAGNGFGVDDEVITVYNSKWVRNRVLIPTSKVIKKPPELDPKLAAISIGKVSVADIHISNCLNTAYTSPSPSLLQTFC